MCRFAGATQMPVNCKNGIKKRHQIRETYEHHEKFNKAMRSLR